MTWNVGSALIIAVAVIVLLWRRDLVGALLVIAGFSAARWLF